MLHCSDPSRKRKRQQSCCTMATEPRSTCSSRKLSSCDEGKASLSLSGAAVAVAFLDRRSDNQCHIQCYLVVVPPPVPGIVSVSVSAGGAQEAAENIELSGHSAGFLC